MADLGVNIAGVHFKNPVITASGTFGFGQEYARLYDISRLGGISCKGTTLKDRTILVWSICLRTGILLFSCH